MRPSQQFGMFATIYLNCCCTHDLQFQEACLAGKWGTSVLQVLQACSVFTNLSLEHNRLEINLQYVYHALLSFGMAHPLSTIIHYAMFAVTISSPDHAYCVGHKWAGTRLPCSQQIGFYRPAFDLLHYFMLHTQTVTTFGCIT